MHKYFKVFVIYFFTLFIGACSVATVTAQSMGKAQSMKVDNLSDEQVIMMMQRAKSMGYSDQNIVQYAKSEGLSSLEITKLSGRINKIRNEENKQKRTFSKRQEEKKKELLADDSKQSAVQKNQKIELVVLPSTQNFGYHVFNKKNRALSFETTLNFPPPIGYVLGAGDQIVIDVFGASEYNYTESIETNGQIFLRNVGPIYLNGLTLKEAQIKIKT